MKPVLCLTAALAVSLCSAGATSLVEQLPAGALLTLETKNAGGAIDRLSGLLVSAMNSMSGDQDGSQVISGFQQILKGSLGQEAALGVFSVGTAGGTFTPQVLAVSRVDKLSGEFFASLLKPQKGARVGNYTFSRQGNTFAGMAGGLVYVSTNKDLLMGYLGRLSGKAAPQLMNSVVYTVPKRAVGQQELSLFLNFSATAKVVRAALAKATMLPRLLSPAVDALDTLGQYASGFSTTAAGLSAASAHAANAQGKDRPLYRILTDSTDFAVQDIIPAGAESVMASACHPESGAYLGRWLTRIDLLDPLGFLSDSQLASHLERSAAYLGHECAQVTLAGGLKAGLDTTNPLAATDYSVSYARVTDLEAARRHMPEYAQSINAAVAGAADSLGGLIGQDTLGKMGASLPGELGAARAAGGAAVDSSLKMLGGVLGNLKLVYAFRGDYLITAWSQKALDAALDEDAAPLAQDVGFLAAGLNMQSAAGWTYVPDLEDISGEEFATAIMSSLAQDGLMDDDLDASEMEEEEMEEDDAAFSNSEMMAGMVGTVADFMADLFNRYDGQSGQSTVQGNVITSKANVLYRW